MDNNTFIFPPIKIAGDPRPQNLICQVKTRL
jgi:hypothetical protein